LPSEVYLTVLLLGAGLVLVALCGCGSSMTPLGHCYAGAMLLMLAAMAACAMMVLAAFIVNPPVPASPLYASNDNATLNVTTWSMEGEALHKVFIESLKRGAFDCDVTMKDGQNCSSTGGLNCKANSARHFQWAVNRLCVPGESCQGCLGASQLDPLDPRNHVWCKCSAAFTKLVAQAWPLVLLIPAWHCLVFIATVKLACGVEAAVDENNIISVSEPLINE